MTPAGELRYRGHDENTYTFARPGGEEVQLPRVSRILEPVMDFDGLPPDKREEYMARGGAVHEITQLVDTKGINMGWLEKTYPDLVPYAIAAKKFRADVKPIHAAIEIPVCSLKRKYAGRPDRISIISGKIYVLDYKSGSMYPYVGPQLSSYLEAVREMGLLEAIAREHKVSPRLAGRMAVVLRKDGTYKIELLAEPLSDLYVFLSCLTIHQWREKKYGKGNSVAA